MKENWQRWEPISGLVKKYYVESLSDKVNGFELLLSEANNSNILQVLFPDSVHAYRSSDESFRQTTLQYLDEQYGSEFYSEWTFFKVEDSEYMQWLVSQSYEILESELLTHFVFLASDSIVDVIAAYEPLIKAL